MNEPIKRVSPVGNTIVQFGTSEREGVFQSGGQLEDIYTLYIQTFD